MKRYNEHIIQRIKEYLTGVLDPKGRKALESWHKQDARNREFFERVCRENTISQEDAIYAKTDERKAFRRFQTRVRGKKRTLTRAIGYAAALLLPLAGIALWLKTESLTTAPVPEIAPGSSKAVLTLAGGEQVYLKEGEKHESAKLEKMAVEQREGLLSYKAAKRKEVTKTTEYNTLATGRGGEFRLELSDGTIVYLNASTTLRYPVAFGDGKRQVELEGEAYFDVARDSAHAFVVKARNAEVEVYGTSFDVTTFYEGEVRAVLVTGSIGVRSAAGQAVKQVAPGQMAIYDESDKSIAVKDTDVTLYTSWKDGLFKFEEERLEDIMETLSRWYDMDVFFHNDALRNTLFTGDLRRYDNIDEHLRMLEMTTNVAFDVRGKAVFVRYKE